MKPRKQAKHLTEAPSPTPCCPFFFGPVESRSTLQAGGELPPVCGCSRIIPEDLLLRIKDTTAPHFRRERAGEQASICGTIPSS